MSPPSTASPSRTAHALPALLAACLALALALAPHPGAAQPADAPPPEALHLVFRGDDTCATADAQTSLLEQVLVRLPELLVAPSGTDDPAAAVLAWLPSSAGTCQLVVSLGAEREHLPLGPAATEDELRGAAIRVAWWLASWYHAQVAAPPSGAAEDDAPAEQATADELPPGGQASLTDPDSAPEAPDLPQPARLPFEVGAELGFGWYPTPGAASGLARFELAIPVVGPWQLVLEGRLGTEVNIASPGQDTDFFDRSLGLRARHRTALADRLALDVGLGLRYGLPELEVAGSPNAAARIERPVSNLMVVSGAGVGFALSEALRVRLDILAAFSVADRRIEGPDGELADLGVVTLDAALGFELGF